MAQPDDPRGSGTFMACVLVQVTAWVRAAAVRRQEVRVLPLGASAPICQPGPSTSVAARRGSAGRSCQPSPSTTISAWPVLRMTPAALALRGWATDAARGGNEPAPLPLAVDRTRALPSCSASDSVQRPLALAHPAVRLAAPPGAVAVSSAIVRRPA